jgi:hypothetical protein
LGLSFGKLFGARLVHKSLQVGCFWATEHILSDTKEMKRGEYEQGRMNWKTVAYAANAVVVVIS